MSARLVGWTLAAALSVAPGLAAQAGGWDYGGYGYDRGYGDGGYQGDDGSGGYEDGGYGYGGRYGYDYGASPDAAPAHYCREHLEYHLHQAWMNDQAPYHDWWGTGGPEAWHEAMEADHARFHYSHPGSWRCEYQGWPSG